MKNTVTIHKELNRSAIPFFKEKALDFFADIMKRWNNMQEYEPLIFNLKEFKKSLDLESSKNDNYFSEFIKTFSSEFNKEWTVGKFKVYGNIFTIAVSEELNVFEIHFNERIRSLIFTKKDIDMMVKNKQKLRMTTQELEEYKRNKEKYENLMLYSKTEILGISGKYNKRLYTLLIQFKNQGKFFMNYDVFKDVMETPKSYQASDIDKKIFTPAIEELKKANIFINKIEKNKKGGRSIKVIEIYFTYKEERKTKKIEINTINSVKSIAEKYGMTVEERNNTGLEQVRKIRVKMKKAEN